MFDEEHNERKRPFVITADFATKQDDVIAVRYDPDWSAMRSGRAERPVFAYAVENTTKGTRYSCEIFESDRGELMAFCNCLARVSCKHIAACLKDYTERQEIAARQVALPHNQSTIGD